MGRALLGVSVFGFALGAWLALPLHDPDAGRRLSIAIFDRSASVERTRPGLEAWMSATAEAERLRALSLNSDFAALVFAGNRTWWLRPGSASREAGPPPRVGDTQESDLTAALELARAGAADVGASDGRLRLYSDCRNTGHAIDESLRALARAGMQVEQLELPAPELDDIALVEMRTPERVEEGAPLAAQIEVEARLAGAGASQGSGLARAVQIEFQLSWGGKTRQLKFARQLDSGRARDVWRFDLGAAPAGGLEVAVRLGLAGDPIPENDSAAAWVDVGGALEIAVVTPSNAEAGDSAVRASEFFATDAERWPGLAFLPTSLEGLPLALSHVRAVLTLDVDPGAIPGDLMREFIESGGGWLDCSGSAALRAQPSTSGVANGARALLALLPDAPERPPRDVLLLIDGSGSMAGAVFDGVRNAALELAGVVPAQDRLMLAFFTRNLEPACVLRDANGVRPAQVDLAALLRARSPSGGTDVLGALEQLAVARKGETRQTLALLLSDGRDPRAAEHPDQTALRAALAASRVELCVFAFGPDSDAQFLASLLPPGRELTRIEDPLRLAEVFSRAVDAQRVRQPTVLVQSAPDSFSEGSLAREVAQALASTAPSSIERSWIARTQGSAEVLWRSVEGDPLLALRGQGLGACAGLASLPAKGWAFAAREPAVLAPLLRVLARGGPLRTQRPRATLERGVLWIRGLDRTYTPTLGAIFADGTELELAPPTEFAQSPVSTRCAEVPAALLALLSRPGQSSKFDLVSEQSALRASFALAPPPPAEFFQVPLRIGLPDRVSGPSSTGGGERTAHPAARGVLLGALALLLAALWLGLKPA